MFSPAANFDSLKRSVAVPESTLSRTRSPFRNSSPPRLASAAVERTSVSPARRRSMASMSWSEPKRSWSKKRLAVARFGS